MSHFYVECQGSRGEVTRCGTAASGVRAYARGWGVGGIVEVGVDQDGNDRVSFYATDGSNGHRRHLIASIANIRDVMTDEQAARL